MRPLKVSCSALETPGRFPVHQSGVVEARNVTEWRAVAAFRHESWVAVLKLDMSREAFEVAHLGFAETGNTVR